MQSTQTFELVSISGFNPNDGCCRTNAVWFWVRVVFLYETGDKHAVVCCSPYCPFCRCCGCSSCPNGLLEERWCEVFRLIGWYAWKTDACGRDGARLPALWRQGWAGQSGRCERRFHEGFREERRQGNQNWKYCFWRFDSGAFDGESRHGDEFDDNYRWAPQNRRLFRSVCQRDARHPDTQRQRH